MSNRFVRNGSFGLALAFALVCGLLPVAALADIHINSRLNTGISLDPNFRPNSTQCVNIKRDGVNYTRCWYSKGWLWLYSPGSAGNCVLSWWSSGLNPTYHAAVEDRGGLRCSMRWINDNTLEITKR